MSITIINFLKVFTFFKWSGNLNSYYL